MSPRTSRRSAASAAWRELFGLGSVFAMACAYLAPAVKDGARFGSFDFVVPLTSLGRTTKTVAPFNHLNSDVVSQMNAWNGLDWSEIHAGHFPLWNDLTLLGVPHFLNFESAVLSLPDVVSYLVPLRFAFLVAVLAKLLIAGFGAYVLGRVVGLRPFGASFAGISFMLSGAFANWLSWPLSDVVAWLGWILAFCVLTYRFPHRMRYPAALALSVGFCMYGGFPEANIFVACSLAVLVAAFVLATLVLRWIGDVSSKRTAAPSRLARRAFSLTGALSVAGALAVGVALSLPLWWPGLQVLDLAHRRGETRFLGLPAHSLALLVAQGYYGLPTKSNPWFLTGWNYYQTASYVGVVMLVLAAVAVVRYWRHPTVLALAALCIVALLVSWQTSVFHPVQTVLNNLAGQVQWSRFRTVLGLPLGLLGGMGLESMARTLRYSSRRGHRQAVLSGFTAATLAMIGLCAFLLVQDAGGLVPAAEAHAANVVRYRSLIWPGLSLACCIAVLACVVGLERLRARRRRHGAARPARSPAFPRWLVLTVLWSANAGTLLFAGVGINSYSHSYYGATAPISEVKHFVGTALVGLDTGKRSGSAVQSFTPVGLYPEVNLGYGIAEFAGHDPALPEEYFTAFGAPSTGPGYFEPDVSSVAEARRYGVGWVLAVPGAAPIAGADLVKVIAGESLYEIPGAARFTLSRSGDVASVTQPSPSEYDLTVRVPPHRRARLLARVTDVPGWHATVDGRPVPLSRADEVMMSLAVPAGRHRIKLWYWPDRLTQGIIGAVAGAAALVLWAVAVWAITLVAVARRRRRRRRSREGTESGSAGSSEPDEDEPGEEEPGDDDADEEEPDEEEPEADETGATGLGGAGGALDGGTVAGGTSAGETVPGETVAGERSGGRRRRTRRRRTRRDIFTIRGA